MDFQDVVDRRRMVRNFTAEPVAAAQRDRILANALHAPSAGFSQGWAFLVLETDADRERFWRVADDEEEEATPSYVDGLRRAPLLVVPMSHKDGYLDRYAEPDKGWTDRSEAHWPVPYWHIDTGMASLLMLLTAVDEGLGACFFGPPPDVPAFRAEFGVPEAFMPIGVLAIGHRAPDRRSPSLLRGRRPLSDVAHIGQWGRHPG
jgi:nitroreductase